MSTKQRDKPTHTQQTLQTSCEKATFGAGCFWGVEAAFRLVTGVLSTRAGYMGGTIQNPTYHDVCSDRTGHAEVVEVTFDPQTVSYSHLLDVFWKSHNPTTPNRQGPDIGSQYRSVIFYHSEIQKRLALRSKEVQAKLSCYIGKTIATEIVPATVFYEAEEYHQHYLDKRNQRSCHL